MPYVDNVSRNADIINVHTSMKSDLYDVYEGFRDFPPLYTEQINDVALSKQLEIWEGYVISFIRRQLLFFINADNFETTPFGNLRIQRVLKRKFVVLIAQHMIEQGYGFYQHPILTFCRNNKCSIWGALFINKKTKAGQIHTLHRQEYRRIASLVERTNTSITMLKAKRDVVNNGPFVVGVFAKTIDETAQDILHYLRGQLSTTQIETPYYLFYGDRESTIEFRAWPEEHVAIMISILATQGRIMLTSNETVELLTLNSKQLGIQLAS